MAGRGRGAVRRDDADPRVTAYLNDRPFTRAESDANAARVRRHFDEHGWGKWAVDAPGVADFIGVCGLAHISGLAHFSPSVEIGWRFAAAHWGRGYATEAARAALAFGFEQLALGEIVAFTSVSNARSRAMMERLGMVYSPGDDFDHPMIPQGSPIRRHVLYRSRHRQPR